MSLYLTLPAAQQVCYIHENKQSKKKKNFLERCLFDVLVFLYQLSIVEKKSTWF